MQSVVLLAILAGAAAVEVTPIDKVITLIKGLKSEVESDGKSEAAAYEKFSCFCKDKTGSKSKSVQKGTKNIGVLSADIGDKTQEQADDRSELKGRKQDHEDMNRKLDETTTRCAKEKAEYEATSADLSAAIAGLKGAIKSMTDSKPSLIEIKQTLGKTFEIAEAMNLLQTPKHKTVAAMFLQVDPKDAKFGFHSDEIIDVCNDLLKDYNAEKKSVDTEFGKTSKACDQMKASLRKKLGANKGAMDALDKNIAKLAKEIAQHRTDLITAQGQLQDDELYLKDLQARCEDRANDYDQRSAMRGSELDAFNGALKVLTGTVDAATSVNERALFIQKAEPTTKDTKETAAPAPKTGAVVKEVKAVSFLQNFLSSSQGLSQEARQQRAIDILRTEGQRLGSLALTSLAEHASADPFKKIKGLIQKLIERMLEESRNEASKKGFCDTELGKARKTRDYRFTEAKDLSAEISGLQAKRDALTQEIKDLKSDIKEETLALKQATEDRKAEKAVNAKITKTAKEGLEGVTEAILILKSFYKQAAKAVFFLQVQASPVTERAGFSGNYGGKQDGMKAVFALLETIQSDFDRTLRKTEEAEHTAHREYVDFSQVSKSSISGKEMKQKLDEEDLETTLTNLEQATSGLQTAVDLLDGALEELEELKPTCMDSGMSYSDRVAKREEEMKALQKALCQLDEDGVESSCK